MNELGVDQAINLKIKSIIEQIENLGDEDRLKVFDNFGSATSDTNKKIGSLGITQGDIDLANQMAKFNENLKTESYLRKLEGNDPNKLGVAGFQKRDIAGRDKDRLLTGGALIGDMLTRMALINKL